MIARLQRLVDDGVLRPLDQRLAALLAAHEPADGRIVALSAALVSWRAGQGDVCVPLAAYAGRPLFPYRDASATGEPARPIFAPPIEEWQARLEACRCVGRPGDWQPLILDGDHLYLGRFHAYESRVAAALLDRLQLPDSVDPRRLRDGLNRLFPGGDAALDWQRVAAAVATLRPFAVISGGPGTGKTTTVVRLLALLLEQNLSLRIRLAAPTGKAADRLAASVASLKAMLPVEASVRDVIPETASTLHRLLGADGRGAFRHGAKHPIHADVVVLDEASMVDLPMMVRLLDALPQKARLILLGDRDQLASVEAGRILGDICGHGRTLHFSEPMVAALDACGAARPGALVASGHAAGIADAVVSLRVSHRFAADSGIGRLARELLAHPEGFDPQALIAESRDVRWMESAAPMPGTEVVSWAADRYAQLPVQTTVAEALEAFAAVRVLCALHRGEFGVMQLNARIEQALTRSGVLKIDAAGDGHYHGRPLLVTSNDYARGLFNGDVGIVWGEGDVRAAWFPAHDGGEPRRVALHDLPPHETAFAMSVHKSQGSEFDAVLFVLPVEPTAVATRELVYTAVTRARSDLAIAASGPAFVAASGRNVARHTRLAIRLGWAAVDDAGRDDSADVG